MAKRVHTEIVYKKGSSFETFVDSATKIDSNANRRVSGSSGAASAHLFEQIGIAEDVLAEISDSEDNSDVNPNYDSCDTSPRVLVRKAKSVVFAARVVVESRHRIMDVISEAIDAGEKHIAMSLRKADIASKQTYAAFYRNLASKITAAVGLITYRAPRIEAAANDAEISALNADNASRDLMKATMEASNNVIVKMHLARKAAKDVNAKIIGYMKAEYAVLEPMWRCWREIDEDFLDFFDPERSTYRQGCNTILIMVLTSLSFVAGCAIFAFFAVWTPSSDSYSTMLMVATTLTGLPILMFIYWLVIIFIKKRKMIEREASQQVIKSIQERIEKLDNYFAFKGISNQHAEDENERGYILAMGTKE